MSAEGWRERLQAAWEAHDARPTHVGPAEAMIVAVREAAEALGCPATQLRWRLVFMARNGLSRAEAIARLEPRQ